MTSLGKSGGTWAVMDDEGNNVFEGGGASEEALAGDGAWTDQTVEARPSGNVRLRA